VSLKFAAEYDTIEADSSAGSSADVLASNQDVAVVILSKDVAEVSLTIAAWWLMPWTMAFGVSRALMDSHMFRDLGSRAPVPLIVLSNAAKFECWVQQGIKAVAKDGIAVNETIGIKLRSHSAVGVGMETRPTLTMNCLGRYHIDGVGKCMCPVRVHVNNMGSRTGPTTCLQL